MASIIKRRLLNRLLGNTRHYCEKGVLERSEWKMAQELDWFSQVYHCCSQKLETGFEGKLEPRLLDKEET